MKIGTTYSTFHIQERKLDIIDSFDRLLYLNFDLIRIGTYWNQIEKNKGEFDFSLIHRLLEKTESNNQKIILTVGAKSPRWPEFHIPNWALDKCNNEDNSNILNPIKSDLLNLIENTVKEFQNYKCIYAWQVENEPLDPSGPNSWVVEEELLNFEVELVKSFDNRPIIVNLWGNELNSRGLLNNLPNSTDIVGIDLYYRVPSRFFNYYSKPKDSDSKINEMLNYINKPNMITELQAEPWENKKGNDTPSISPDLLRSNYYRVKKNIETSAILLWGYEFWYNELLKGNRAYWTVVQELIKEKNSSVE